MGTGSDFLQCLESDMVVNIFKCLGDPADLVRSSLVSRNWRDFVVSNGLSKQLCLAIFPQLSNAVHVSEPDSSDNKESDVGCSKSVEWKIAQTELKVYAALFQALEKLQSLPVDCISEAFSASSTDNSPDESIIHTLDPRDRFSTRRASYWSSEGQKDPTVPETLVYKLKDDLCVVTEIAIQPFEAFFQSGDPIYSSRSVRFQMGHPKSPEEIATDLLSLPLQKSADDKFIWTYTSEKFPMSQENRLQHFKLPEPVLCIGGFLQIQLLGRIQKQEMDGLFYICVSHVKILGRPLSPAFQAEIVEPSGKFLLKYFPDALQETIHSNANGSSPNSSHAQFLASEEMLWRNGGLLQYLVGEHHRDDDMSDFEDDENDNNMVEYAL